jgi:hypothetical protein
MSRSLRGAATAVLVILGLVFFPAQPSVAGVVEPPSAKPAIVRGNEWLLRTSATSGVAEIRFTYGNGGTDIPLMGDWDGDGVATPAIVRNGQWFLRNSNTSGVADVVFSYGNGGSDIPIVGDWDGDGVDTPGVVRGGLWYLRNANTSGVADLAFAYGNAIGDLPIVGDWNGDGVDSPGIVRSLASGGFECVGNENWFLRDFNSSGVASIAPFCSGAIPAVGDWDGDADDTSGWFQAGLWVAHVANSTASDAETFSYGSPGDRVLVWH